MGRCLITYFLRTEGKASKPKHVPRVLSLLGMKSIVPESDSSSFVVCRLWNSKKECSILINWFQWMNNLRRESADNHFLGLRVRIPTGHKCLYLGIIVLPSTGLCKGLIPHTEDSYRLWCVILCNLRTSRMGCCARGKKLN